MTTTQVSIIASFSRESRDHELYLRSDLCGASESSELWVGSKTEKYMLVSPDSYYNDALRERRNNGNMVANWDKNERVILVGQVWSPSVPLPPSSVVLATSTIEAEISGT
ncbi:hypothetical protein [Microbulbifer sp. M83]|uniref:hypothetical protein n=1 Tax=Microbulbifer sp. M83 TaxID=3118246 RepID=UPI002FE1A1A2